MITWRERKQIFIFIIVIFPFVLGAIWLIEKIIPDPSCFDNKLNQSEFQIDCGDGCTACALKYPKAITVFWARAVQVRDKTYDVAAEIENPNELIASGNVEYEFTLYDKLGAVASKKGSTFIYSQERILVVETGLETTRIPTRAELHILHIDWLLRNDPKPLVSVEKKAHNIERFQDRTYSTISAIIYNESPLHVNQIVSTIVALDAQENLIGVSHSVMSDVQAGDRRPLKASWPTLFSEEPTIIRIESRMNIFDPRTIIKPF